MRQSPFCAWCRAARVDGKAKWPDDSTEIVETFAEYFEALRWLSTQCTVWIDERMTVKEAG